MGSIILVFVGLILLYALLTGRLERLWSALAS